jgi:hypothetical protein
MRIASLAILFFFLGQATAASVQDRPTGLNCNLAAPPRNAGEEQNHGVILRVFPRAKEIGATYSGCQILFAPDGKGWTVVSLTEIVEGDPTRVWSQYERIPEKLQCRYKAGKVVEGNPDSCPAPEFVLIKSMAPGCVRVVRRQVAKSGLGAGWPPECQYD